MMRTIRNAAASRSADNHWYASLSARYVSILRSLIHNLIHRDRREIREHNLRDGPQTGDGGPDGGTYDRRFGNGGIANPFLSELRCQALRNLKHTSGPANIYPHQYD